MAALESCDLGFDPLRLSLVGAGNGNITGLAVSLKDTVGVNFIEGYGRFDRGSRFGSPLQPRKYMNTGRKPWRSSARISAAA